MLEWNVYNEDVNKGEIEIYNIFNHTHFVKSLVDMFKNSKKEEKRYNKENNLSGLITHKQANDFKKHIENFEDKQLRNICQYYFWAKCEYELILTDWPTSIAREEIYRLVNEDQEYFNKYGTYPYRFTPNLCVGKKIDIYEQLKLNWEQFKKYVFDNEKEIKKLYKNDYLHYWFKFNIF